MKASPAAFFKKTIALLCASSVVAGFAGSFRAEEERPHISVDLDNNGEGYSEVLYDNTNGLPTSEANAIVETDDGFIFIGSYSGLIRYDGNTFERIDSTGGIASVVSLFADSRDRLWIGTNDSGLAVMDKDDIRIYNRSDGLKSLSIRAIAESETGEIYIATTRGMAVIDEEMNLELIDEPLINDEFIRNISFGADGLLYGVTMEGSILVMNGRTLAGFYTGEDLNIDNIHSMLPDPDAPGYVYIGTTSSRILYGELSSNMTDAQSIDISPLEYVNSMSKIDGMIWISADTGIGYIEDGELTVINDVPLNSSVEGVIEDYQGNLWFISSKQGVMKIVPNQFNDIFARYGIAPNVVNSTCYADGTLYIGTKNDGLIAVNEDGIIDEIPLRSARLTNGEELPFTDLLQMLQGAKIRSVIKDNEGRLWFSTYGDSALVRYDHGEAVRFTTEDGLPSSRIRTVYECRDGSVLVACTGGVAVIEGDEVTRVYDSSSGISNTEVLTATEGSGGRIFIGTDGDGIYVIDGDDITHLSIEDGLMSDVIMRIKHDVSRDIYWIVASNSIAYMDDDLNITTINNFPYSNNFDLYENSIGDMWVLSSNGIYITSVDDLISNDEIDTIYYGFDNGLPCIATANSYSALTDDGNLYIAGTTGVAKVNIEDLFEDISELKVSLPYIEADGVRIYPNEDGAFEIPSGTRKTTIFGYVFTYSLINPEITYMLDGFDSEPVTVRRSEFGSVDYTNLGGGEYEFVISVSDPMGRVNNTMSFRIIKVKAFYEESWFYIIAILILAWIVWLIVRKIIEKKTRAAEAKAARNKELVREMVEAFSKTIDMKDKYTNGHSRRVAEYTRMLAYELGYDDDTVDEYYNIALLHDIGKIGVDPEVLNKPGTLTDREFAIIKSHSALGYNVLKDISIMPDLALGAGAHHERPDGKGYPKGLKGDEIPRVAQIIAVADTFDAMYSDRPYRKRMNFEKAVSIIREVSGTQLTSDVVDAFLRLVERGYMRAPDDDGGGSTEDIDNIHKKNKGKTDSES